MTCNAPKAVGACLAAALTLALVTRPAHAQAEDQAAARALFEEGRKLLKRGQYAEACEKLEGASKLYTSAGILLNLGDCYAKSGRTASAWTEFGEAVTVAKRTGRTSEGAEASRRQAEIEPKLTRLTIRVAHPNNGLVVTRDGTDVPEAAWGTAMPVDPGNHDVRAEARGYEPWTGSARAWGEGKTAVIEVPELDKSPAPEAPAAPPEVAPSAPRAATEPMPEPARAPSRVLEWTLIGAGAAVGIAGGALMLVESSRAHAATDRNDKVAFDSAKTPWAVGLGCVIAGGAAVATGVILFPARHGEAATARGIRFSPWVSVAGGGMEAGGAF